MICCPFFGIRKMQNQTHYSFFITSNHAKRTAFYDESFFDLSRLLINAYFFKPASNYNLKRVCNVKGF